jgi:hypothetical protein
MSQYIQPNEYPLYGLPNTTTTIQVKQASALIDGWLRRPEGLVYGVDYTGQQPAFMVGLSPTFSFTSAGAITSAPVLPAPSTSGQVQLAGPGAGFVATQEMIGQPVVLDRANPNLCEVCVVAAINNVSGSSGPAIFTLQSFNQPNLTTVNNHAAGCTIEFGLSIMEERTMPEKRSLTRTMRPPLAILAGMGRYGYGTRLDQIKGLYSEFNLLATISEFGGPPQWIPFPAAQSETSQVTHEIWLPAGLLLSYFTEMRLYYVSGFTQTNLPMAVKQACAQIVTAFAFNTSIGMSANFTQLAVGTSSTKRDIASVLDPDTLEMLRQYRAKINI